MKNITIEGIPSGDGECFCLDVTPEEYIRFKGKESYDTEAAFREDFNKECMREMYPSDAPWRIYPNDLFKPHGKKVKITITIEEV
jgi:hypothetical protein